LFFPGPDASVEHFPRRVRKRPNAGDDV
jgi:hypothetical protein